MSLSIVVNGGGTFTASMEEGPVSFTASLAAVGPAGPGVAVGGAAGTVLAKASATNYDTEWVARNPFDQDLNTTDSPTFEQVTLNAGGPASIVITNTDFTWSDGTTQTTALPTGLDDGYIVEWNADTSTYLSVPNDARTLFITARNITGTTIPKGSVVLITGATGNRPTIGLAQGNTAANADGVIGITAAAINNNANGRVITEGLASNLNTSAFAAGDKLYLSATTPGGLVNVRPVQPAHSVAVGVVTRSNPAVGSIEVRVQVGEHLEFLHDVLLTSKTNLDLLSYETSSGLWKNKSFSTLGLLTSATAASTYLTTSTAASTYAPLASPTFTGTVTIPAGASISGFAPLASPVFTGVPEAPTAAATTNTTQVATTAFVQQEVPAASTTAAGKVELATDAEAVAGTSATLATTIRTAQLAGMLNVWSPNVSAMSAANSGTGSNAGSSITALNGRLVAPNSLTAGYASRGFNTYFNESTSSAGVSYDGPVAISSNFNAGNWTGENIVARAIWGRRGGSIPAPTYTVTDKSFGFEIEFKTTGGELRVFGHDGTNLTTSVASFSPTNARTFQALAISQSGTVRLYVNGTEVASTTGGPTGNDAGQGWAQWEIVNDSTATINNRDIFFSNPKVLLPVN